MLLALQKQTAAAQRPATTPSTATTTPTTTITLPLRPHNSTPTVGSSTPPTPPTASITHPTTASNTALAIEMLQILYLAAVCVQSLAQYDTTVTYFTRALTVDQDSYFWFQREVALYLWTRLDRDLKTFSIDQEVDPRIKEGWCRRSSWRQTMNLGGQSTIAAPSSSSTTSTTHSPQIAPDLLSNTRPRECDADTRYIPLRPPTPFGMSDLSVNVLSSDTSVASAQVVLFTSSYSSWIHLNCR